MESLLIRTIIFTQININNNKKIHFIQNIHNLYVTFLVFTEIAIKRCFSQWVLKKSFIFYIL